LGEQWAFGHEPVVQLQSWAWLGKASACPAGATRAIVVIWLLSLCGPRQLCSPVEGGISLSAEAPLWCSSFQ
jgi:hypothetical protein